MARILPITIDEIMQASRIEEVIGEFVQLKKAGSSLKGLSPFTDEKTPSFVVSPSKQIFKCFSTGKGGSVVTFLMEKEHYSYPEALKWLASKYNIILPEEEEPTAEELAKSTERDSLFIINEFAKNHFNERMLQSDEGKSIGLSYFIERGFRIDIIEKFQLGYSIDKSTDFSDSALKKGFKLEYLEKIGLVKSKENKQFDFFRGRVMFPIHSITGRVLGFGGRTLLADKKIAKYFNSPESIIYNKSDILYGLYFAKGDIVKYDNCYLVEGYTDVISMHQAGVTNVVSSSGTSLTQGQIKLIRRYTKNVTILYDGDTAGIKASFRGIDLLLEEGLNVRVVLFPDGDDPDSFAKKAGPVLLQEYIKSNTKDFLTFKAEALLTGSENDPLNRSKLIHDIVFSISLIPDDIIRSVYVKEIASRFDIEQQIIQKELTKLRNNALPKSKEAVKQLVNETPTYESTGDITEDKKKIIEQEIPQDNYAEFDLIRILVRYGACALEIEQLNEQGAKIKNEVSVAELICHELHRDSLTFTTPTFNTIHQLISEGITKNILYKSSYLLRSENQDIVKLVSKIETDHYEVSPNWLIKNIDTEYEIDNLKQAVTDSLYVFKTNKIEQRIKEIRIEIQALSDSENINELEDLIIEQMNLEKVKIAFAEKLGRIIIR
jgi:DNA primase